MTTMISQPRHGLAASLAFGIVVLQSNQIFRCVASPVTKNRQVVVGESRLGDKISCGTMSSNSVADRQEADHWRRSGLRQEVAPERQRRPDTRDWKGIRCRYR